MLLRAAIFLLFLPISLGTSVQDPPPPASSYQSAVGKCLVELRKVLPVTQSLDYFVGTGWDNLRNVHTRPVLLHTFNDCQTTPEGNYLIPDNVIAIPIQKTEFDQMATFHDSFSSYFESVTDTINAEASGHFFIKGLKGKISGSFSQKNQKTKLEMATISNNLFVTKMKAHSYSLLVNPDAGLHPVFKNRLLLIADLLKNGLIERAMFESQLIVRDYGTHYLSRTEVGAIIEQSTYVTKDFNYKSEAHLDEMKATVSASFSYMFYGGGSASISTGKIVSNEMKKNLSTITRHVRVNSEGPLPQLITSCAGDNKTCIDDNLVALDHQGEPLFYLINSYLLPELRNVEIDQLSNLLENATLEYYTRNSITGCTDPKDTNFYFPANINDTSCKGKETEIFNFGGVYQICDIICEKMRTWDTCPPASRCDQFIQRNPATGDFTCPVGYRPEQIVDYIYAGFEDRVVEHDDRKCHDHFFYTKCDHHIQHIIYKDKVRLRSYSCVPINNTSAPVYLFGGLYARGHPNLWTDSESCPPFYLPAKIIGDVSICLSGDKELGGPYKVPLNGMFSCQTPEHKRRCPKGYSAHLATITSTQCEVYYCIQAGVYKRFDLPHIQRPPYLPPSFRLSNVSVDYVKYFVNETLLIAYPLEVVLNETAKYKMEENESNNLNDINEVVAKWIQEKLKEKEGSNIDGDGANSWASVWLAFGILGILMTMTVVVLSVLLYRRRANRYQELNET